MLIPRDTSIVIVTVFSWYGCISDSSPQKNPRSYGSTVKYKIRIGTPTRIKEKNSQTLFTFKSNHVSFIQSWNIELKHSTLNKSNIFGKSLEVSHITNSFINSWKICYDWVGCEETSTSWSETHWGFKRVNKHVSQVQHINMWSNTRLFKCFILSILTNWIQKVNSKVIYLLLHEPNKTCAPF